MLIFGVDNSSSSHTDNLKNDFLILGEGSTFVINGNFGTSDKKFDISFRKAYTKFCLSLHYNADNSYLFVNGKEIYKSKASNKNNNFPSRFCPSRTISNEFNTHYNSIDKFNVLNIHKYLMIKNNI